MTTFPATTFDHLLIVLGLWALCVLLVFAVELYRKSKNPFG